MTISAVKHNLYVVNDTWLCAKCGVVKPLTDFYARKGSGCKVCVLADQMAKRRAKNLDKILAKEAMIASGEKACSRCKVVKPFSEFVQYKRYKTGISRCNSCMYEITVENRAKIKSDPEKHEQYKAKKRDYNKSDKSQDTYYKRTYGISLETVRSMLVTQNGMCANICCQKEIRLATVTERATAVVDHCHTSDKVRALLCEKCNLVLGQIETNEKVIPGLLEYLRQHKIKEQNQ